MKPVRSKIDELLLRTLVGNFGVGIALIGFVEMAFRSFTVGSVVTLIVGVIIVFIAIYGSKK